jgi:hypothetical protein
VAKEKQPGGNAAAAADRVRAILEAAEQSAAALRAEAAEEIDAQLKRAKAVAERLSARADQIERSLEGLAGSVRDELSALKADLEELRAVSEGVGETHAPPPEPEPEGEPTAVGEPEPDAPEPTAVAEPEPDAAEPTAVAEPGPAPTETSAATAAPSAGDGHEGARVIALNMALNGASREETARYLSENFDLKEPDALLDEVYARVSG